MGAFISLYLFFVHEVVNFLLGSSSTQSFVVKEPSK